MPYVVYSQDDETGLVHDQLWALIERGAALLQVRPCQSGVHFFVLSTLVRIMDT